MVSRIAGVYFVAALAGAATLADSVRPVSLEDCIQEAVEKNLSLRISRYDPELGRVELHQAYGGWDPTFTARAGQNFSVNPPPATDSLSQFVQQAGEAWNDNYRTSIGGLTPTGFRYSVDANLNRADNQRFVTVTNAAGNIVSVPGARFGGYGDAVTLNMRQPLLRDFWIDGTRLNIALAKENLKQDLETVRDQLLTLSRNVANAYYGLIAAKDSIRVQETALSLAERSLAENKKRVEVGAMAPLEEKQAEAQVAASRADLILARETYGRAVNGLKRLMSDDFATLDGVLYDPTATLDATPEVFDKKDSWHKALTLRPTIVQRRIDLERRRISLKFAKNQVFPALDLVGSFGLQGSQNHFGSVLGDIADRRNPNFGLGIELSVPLTRRVAKDRVKTERLGIESALLGYKDLEQAVMREVDDFILTASASLQRLEATKAGQSFAEAALDAEQKKLENGKSTSFQVLQLQRDLVRAQKNNIDALTNYNIALINLAWSEGTLLEKLKINMTAR